jgi:hypothetical protein
MSFPTTGHWGLAPELEKGRSRPLEGFGTGWFHVRQNKQHRWSLDAGQIYQYHLGGEMHPAMRWWEAVNVPRRVLHFIEFGEGFTTAVLICEDLAQNDEVADLIRAIGPTGIMTPLLDGPQLASRWSARYASVFADDPGSAVLTLSAWGLVDRCRPRGRDVARVVGLWKDPSNGFSEIPLEPGAEGILLTACVSPAQRRSNDGRRPVQNAVDLYAVGQHQSRPAATGSQDGAPVRQLSDPPPLDVDDLTILCGCAEAVAEALAYAPSRVAAVLSDAAAGSPWRATLGLNEPSDPLRKAIQLMDDVVSNTAPPAITSTPSWPRLATTSPAPMTRSPALSDASYWPLSSSAKVGVGTRKTNGPHDHSTTAPLCGCHVGRTEVGVT